jgi:hypothetical protein
MARVRSTPVTLALDRGHDKSSSLAGSEVAMRYALPARIKQVRHKLTLVDLLLDRRA